MAYTFGEIEKLCRENRAEIGEPKEAAGICSDGVIS